MLYTLNLYSAMYQVSIKMEKTYVPASLDNQEQTKIM